MKFTDEDIRKYQDLCRRYFDEEVDAKTAIEEIGNLIFLVSLIYHPKALRELERLKRVNESTAKGGKENSNGS